MRKYLLAKYFLANNIEYNFGDYRRHQLSMGFSSSICTRWSPGRVHKVLFWVPIIMKWKTLKRKSRPLLENVSRKESQVDGLLQLPSVLMLNLRDPAGQKGHRCPGYPAVSYWSLEHEPTTEDWSAAPNAQANE